MSAYHQKAIKATARRLKINTHLPFFFAFWAINLFSLIKLALNIFTL